ncbi:hypothetical protein HC752_04905 [Vibrio sp. S9_S30]|uniref:hypothetical protein n=1 Tax=Vibrio sp. S9_S30 TaxID=2720226 RepID=UPI001681097A|nr:hypothetical protein [Vibrio sp. S9_S30]MBD1556269.1 hypothetical protein [Vibrio sp. S9_S30]
MYKESELVSLYKGLVVPILGWQVIELEGTAKGSLQKAWSCWSADWVPFAIEITGDVIFLHDDHVYTLAHGCSDTGPDLITTNDAVFQAFIADLFAYQESINSDEVGELEAKKEQVIALRKRAPDTVKVYFDTELENIEEHISNKTYATSSDGKHRQQGLVFMDTAFNELQKSGGYQDVTLGRKDGKFIIFYSLGVGESLMHMQEVFAKYPADCDIEYIEIDD